MLKRRIRHDRSVRFTLPKLSQLEISEELYGDWKKVEGFTQRIGPLMEETYQKDSTFFCNNIKRMVSKSLDNGTPPKGISWPPHSPRTHDPDHRLLHLNGGYADAVQVMRYKRLTYVGLPLGLVVPNTHISYNVLAIIHEYGVVGNNNTIPARPLWGPVIKEVGGKEGLKKMILANLAQKIKKEFGVAPTKSFGSISSNLK